MSKKQTYEVIYTVEHNGELYEKGSEISLSTEDAAGLLACDAIREYPKPAEQAAKPKKSNKQWGNIWPTKQEAQPAAKPTPEQEVASAAKPTPEQEVASAQPAEQAAKPKKGSKK